MALTETKPIELGFTAPDFSLPDVISGKIKSLHGLKGNRATVVMFICNHCPYVIHIREKLLEVANHYTGNGVAFIAISSNDVENYPDDSPEKMKELAMELEFPFPYLYDESQEVAKAYQAECTPDFNVFDAELKCVYRGRFDASTPGNDVEVTGGDLRACLDQVVVGEEVSSDQKPSMGCNIKWKK